VVGRRSSELLGHRFQPLDKSAIKAQLVCEREAVADVKRRLDDVGLPYKMLWYEEFFGAESREDTLSALGDVIAFIEGRPFQQELLKEGALNILDSADPQMKVNSLATYELVPNIHDIEDELGCEDTGYLFR